MLFFLGTEQSTILSKVFNEVFKLKNIADLDDNVNAAVLKILKSLLLHSNKNVFKNNFVEICTFILSFTKCSNIETQVKILKKIFRLFVFNVFQ